MSVEVEVSKRDVRTEAVDEGEPSNEEAQGNEQQGIRQAVERV